MKQPLLLDVPVDSPTKQQKLDAFKKAFGIWTHHAGHMEESWTALLVPASRIRMGEREMGPMELIAGYCRLLEEQGLLVAGETERDAIAKLCENRGIPFWH